MDCANQRFRKRGPGTHMQFIPGIIFFLASLSISFSGFGQWPGNAPVNPPADSFRIDGTLKTNNHLGDWVHGTGTGQGVLELSGSNWQVVNANYTTWIKDLYNSTSDSIFSGSAFSDNPNTWKWATSKATNKCDINNAMYHVTSSSNSKWIILGGDRLTTTGTSYIDFEFLQGVLVRNANFTFSSYAANGTSPAPNNGRTEGDFVLSMEYSNGGTNATVHYYRWELSGDVYKYVEKPIPSITAPFEPVGSAAAYGRTNGDSTDVPFGAFGTTKYIPYAFVEAAVNIDAILGQNCSGTGLNIKTVFVKTKASDSYNAALKDFVEPQAVNFHFGTSSLSYSGGPFCKVGTATPTYSGSGTFTATPAGLVFSDDPANPSTTGIINLASSSAGTYTVTYTFNSGGGCSGSQTASVTIKPTPGGSGGPATICSGQQTSVSLNQTVSGTTFTWTVSTYTAPTGGSLTGFSGCTSSCTATIAQTISNSGSTDGVARYVVTPTAAGCVGPTFNVDVTVHPLPVVTAGSAVCVGSTLTLSPTTGGTWTSYNTAIATVTNAGVVSGISAGTVSFTYTNTITGCSNTTSAVTVNGRPSAPTVQGAVECALNSIQTLSVSPAASSSLEWYDAATNGSLVSSPTLNSVGTVTYYAEAIQNGCRSATRSPATLTLKAKPAPPSFTIVQPTLCGPATGSVTICNPDAASTYTLVGGTSTQTSGAVVFSGLAAGSNPSFTVTTNGCTSDAANCSSAVNSCPVPRSIVSPEALKKEDAVKTIQLARTIKKADITVKAFPNPFNDQVRFVVFCPEAGQGRLDVVNLLGQQVKTIYEGPMHAGNQTFELKVPAEFRSTLIYTLTMGGKKISGKLVQFSE